MNAKKTAVILVNLGTPTEPTTRAVKVFLKAFLSDRRVVDLPRWWWIPALKGFIVPWRAKKVTQAYQEIWTDQGSPLAVISQKQKVALQHQLKEKQLDVRIELAMTYGEPSLASIVSTLKKIKTEQIILLPLYPQYSVSTTAPVFDQFAALMSTEKYIPEFQFIHNYHDHPSYIKALADRVRKSWKRQGRGQHLAISFHGIPQRYTKEGDPYAKQCLRTAQLLATDLELEANEWSIMYQSRFGKEEWLRPYATDVIPKFSARGIEKLDIICPSFSADCLETLEEVDGELRALFLNHGGKKFTYIHALNAKPEHIAMMVDLIQERLLS